MSQSLDEELTAFEMIPISEEGVEGFHAHVSRSVKYSCQSKVGWWSSSLRLQGNLELCEVGWIRRCRSGGGSVFVPA